MNKKEDNKKNNIKEIYEHYKTDKKYQAKVQLIAGTALIIMLVLYLNISSTTSSYGNITDIKNDIPNQTEEKTTNNKTDLLKEIEDNYEYDTKIKYKQTDEEKELHYYGKSYKENLEINKEENNHKNTYYKVDSRYYQKNNEEYELIKDEIVYDIIEKEEIELASIKEYINKSSLDHVTDYSSGKKEYVYHLKINDVIKSYQNNDKIEIIVVEENNTLKINIDFTKIVNITNKNITECQIEYTYYNINNVIKFDVLIERE